MAAGGDGYRTRGLFLLRSRRTPARHPPVRIRNIPQGAGGIKFANGIFTARRGTNWPPKSMSGSEGGQRPVPTPRRPGGLGTPGFPGTNCEGQARVREVPRETPRAPSAAPLRIGWVRGHMSATLPRSARAFETFPNGYPSKAHRHRLPYSAMSALWTKDLDKRGKPTSDRSTQTPTAGLADRARFGLGRTLLLQGKARRGPRSFTSAASKGGRDWADRHGFRPGWREFEGPRLEIGRSTAVGTWRS